MAEPHWTGYVGMVTGIAGAVISIISYRRSTRLKTIDVQIELKKAINELAVTMEGLAPKLDNADRSRRAVLSARGMHNSGAMKTWEQDMSTAQANRIRLQARADPFLKSDYGNAALEDLSKALVEVHRLQLDVGEMSDKYSAGLAEDDQIRAEIRNSSWPRAR